MSINNSNDYTLGEISGHNIIITVLPNSEYSTTSAANVTINMLNTFHNVRIDLIVGISGGVPSKSYNIRLGDIMVSAPRGDKGGMF